MKGKTFALAGLFCFIASYASNDEANLCGAHTNWQKKYVERHNAMLAGEQPGRYIVGIPVMAGLADMILGYVSGFLWALLTDRTYLILRVDNIDGDCNSRSIEYAYDYRFANWSSFPISRDDYACMLPPYPERVECDEGNKPYISVPAKNGAMSSKDKKLFHFRQVNGGFKSEFKSKDMTKFPEDKYNADVFMFSSNRGVTVDMFNNPFHNSTMRAMGLLPETTFSCLFDFLFQIKPDVCTDACRQTDHTLHALGKPESNTFRIGVHVRDESSPQAEEHFYCADSLVAAAKARGQKAVILLVTASVALQKNMKEKYGDMLLLPNGKPDGVIGVHRGENQQNTPEECARKATQDAIAMKESVRDMHLLSKTDVNIISRDSGFGVVSAMMKPKSKPVIYRMKVENPAVLRDCGSQPDGDHLQILADSWSGL